MLYINVLKLSMYVYENPLNEPRWWRGIEIFDPNLDKIRYFAIPLHSFYSTPISTVSIFFFHFVFCSRCDCVHNFNSSPLETEFIFTFIE